MKIIEIGNKKVLVFSKKDDFILKKREKVNVLVTLKKKKPLTPIKIGC